MKFIMIPSLQKIEIIKIEENYIRSELEQKLYEIELEFERLKKNKAK